MWGPMLSCWNSKILFFCPISQSGVRKSPSYLPGGVGTFVLPSSPRVIEMIDSQHHVPPNPSHEGMERGFAAGQDGIKRPMGKHSWWCQDCKEKNGKYIKFLIQGALLDPNVALTGFMESSFCTQLTCWPCTNPVSVGKGWKEALTCAHSAPQGVTLPGESGVQQSPMLCLFVCLFLWKGLL